MGWGETSESRENSYIVDIKFGKSSYVGQEKLTVKKIAIHPYQNDGSKIKLTEETLTLFYFSIYFHLV